MMLQILRDLKIYTLIRSIYTAPLNADDVKLHWHDYYQFVYARKGNGVAVMENERIPLSENEAMIIRCNEPHTLISCGERFETYEVKFALCDSGKDLLQSVSHYVCKDHSGEINLSLRQMERESDKLDGFSREIVAAEMYKVLLLMQRDLEQSVKAELTASTGSKDAIGDKLLGKIDHYIAENMHRGIMVKDVADFVCFEYKYFSRYFALHYGMRLKQYIAAKQIERAKELLIRTDSSIAAIAGQCGFSDARKLAGMFKASEKMSPTEYRKHFQTRRAVSLETAPDSYWNSPEEMAAAIQEAAAR